MKNVTVAVVLYNAEKLIPHLAETISSLSADMKTVIYDSGSTDNSVQKASILMDKALVMEGPNRGFGFGNNRCLEKVETEYTLLLNSDASISAESLEKLVSFLNENRNYAGVQPLVRLWGWNKVTVSSGVFLTEYGEAWDSRFMHLELSPMRTVQQVPAITAAVSLWRTEALRSVNGFDEGFFMYFEDADLSLRLGANRWKLGVVRDAEASHMVGASSRRINALGWELESSIRIFKKYFGNGSLTAGWWNRELRIMLDSIRKGRPALWRIPLIARAMRGKVERVSIPEEIKAILFGDPLNRPEARTVSKSRGPGWNGDMISPWGGIRTDGAPLTLYLEAVEHSVTGALSSGHGKLLLRFCVSPGTTETVKLAETTSLVYIHCDSASDKLNVRTGVR